MFSFIFTRVFMSSKIAKHTQKVFIGYSESIYGVVWKESTSTSVCKHVHTTGIST